MNYIDPTGHFLGSLFAWVGKVVIGGVVNAVVDTGVQLLTGQEVSLKTIGSSFVEGCVASAAGSAATKLVGKAVGAVKNTKTATKVSQYISKGTNAVKNSSSKIIQKVKDVKLRREIDVKFTTKVTGASRTAHRNNANKAIYAKMQKSAKFRAKMDALTGYDTMAYMKSGKGKALLNPSKNLVWHHNYRKPKMQLISKAQHTASKYQRILHPGGKGGFYNWVHGIFNKR